MTCELVREKMCEYLDGFLCADESGMIEAHLEACDECQREVDELRSTLAWVKQAGEANPPAGLRQAVLSRIEAESLHRRPRRFSASFTNAVAAAAVFLMLVAGNLTLAQPPRMAGTQLMKADEGAQVRSRDSVEIMSQEEDLPRAALPEGEVAITDNAGLGSEADSTVDAGEYSIARSGSEYGEAADSPRSSILPRVLLNVFLLPLLGIFSWLALKKRREPTF